MKKAKTRNESFSLWLARISFRNCIFYACPPIVPEEKLLCGISIFIQIPKFSLVLLCKLKPIINFINKINYDNYLDVRLYFGNMRE